METIDTLRIQIDQADEQLIRILATRAHLVQQIGAIKKEEGRAALDEHRWQEVLQSRKELARAAGLDESFIEEIYNSIHAYALRLEA
ncbi:MAG: hypothetical protein RI911_924 [Candidatus Parcubacteria bacterium]|jgi:chorismate mutase